MTSKFNPVKKKLLAGKWFMLVLCMAGSISLEGQFNIKIGYDGAFASPTHTNALIDTYNEVNAGQLNSPVKPVHWLHGVNMGGRYLFTNYAVELSWESLGTTTKTVVLNGNNASEKKLYYRLNHFSFSQELIFGPLGLGASLDVGNYKIKSELSGTDERKIQSSSSPLTSKFYLAFYLKASDIMSLGIKPYYRMQWGKELGLNGMSNYLLGEDSTLTDSFSHFGISISFYNGWQQ